MHNTGGDLPQSIEPGVLVVERPLLGLFARFTLPEHHARQRNHYPPPDKQDGVNRPGDAEPVRAGIGLQRKRLSMLREGALPVPEGVRRWFVAVWHKTDPEMRKGMMGIQDRPEIHPHADLTPGIVKPVLHLVGRFNPWRIKGASGGLFQGKQLGEFFAQGGNIFIAIQ